MVCPPWHTLRDDVQSVANPVVVVEVLSPSTEHGDRHDKPRHYRRIPSLRHILIVDIPEHTVTHYERGDADSEWTVTDLSDGSVRLTALGIDVPLSEVFRKLDSVPDL